MYLWFYSFSGDIANNDQTLQRGSEAVQPMTPHYSDVSRAWDIMDIMNNIEVCHEALN